MNAGQLINQCAVRIEDVAKITYDPASWRDALNEALLALVLVRPDAHVVSLSIALQLGTQQTLGPDQFRLMGLVRNMGVDGVTPGPGIRGPIRREVIDNYLPDWHTATPGTVVREYMYNDQVPHVFYVYPSLSAVVYVEAEIATKPLAISDPDNESIPVDAVYVPALMERMLYYQYSRDHERSPNWVRAARHSNHFFQLLGVKTQADQMIDPKRLEYTR